MSAAPRHEDGQTVEVEQLRELVHDPGDALATLTQRQAAFERFFENTGEDSAAGETPRLSPYDEAAAIQARRRSMRPVRADGGSQ